MSDYSRGRGISHAFESQLTSGIVTPILRLVQGDDTLSLEIRHGCVEIYYRGGRLLGLHEHGGAASFRAELDRAHLGARPGCPLRLPKPMPPLMIRSRADSTVWVDAVALYKQAMDMRFSGRTKIEREYQQYAVRDNNRHPSGDQSDYVVVDVDYAQPASAPPGRSADFRFDMVGFRWPVPGDGRASNVVAPVIMEMKAGDALLASHINEATGKKRAGLARRIEDIERFLRPREGQPTSERFSLMCEDLKSVYAIKHRLALTSIPRGIQRHGTVEIDTSLPPEVVFVIANHHPASRVLERELAALPAHSLAHYSVAFVGFALFSDELRSVDEVAEDRRRRLSPMAR